MRQQKQQETRRHGAVGFTDAGWAPRQGAQAPLEAEKSRKWILAGRLEEEDNLPTTRC